VEVIPKDIDKRLRKNDVNVYTVEISIPTETSFLRAADAAGFEFHNGKWFTRGRTRGGATLIATDAWSGVRGTASSACYHERGGRAGLCEYSVLIVEDDEENMWTMEAAPQGEDVFNLVLKTFKFVK